MKFRIPYAQLCRSTGSGHPRRRSAKVRPVMAVLLRPAHRSIRLHARPMRAAASPIRRARLICRWRVS